MLSELSLLLIAGASVAFLHTIAGPDHYLPFIALSKSRGWSVAKTLRWTIVCGFGHIASSVVLGLAGAALGWSLSSINFLQSIRGGLAGWIMLLFGLLYAVWGLFRTRINNAHKHFDMAADGELYVYEHKHGQAVTPPERHKVTPWVMFIIFLLGPCEPLIPLLYFPAAKSSWPGMVLLIIVYSMVTIITMLCLVILGNKSLSVLRFNVLERHIHSLAGLTIFICGAAMVFMGW
jgi:sulfite exporter TauE/SafE